MRLKRVSPHTEQEPVQESEYSYDGVTASNTTGHAVVFRASVQPALIFPIHLPPDSHDEYE